MEDGLRQVKSTGYTPPIRTAKGKGLAQVESTEKKSASPVLTIAPTKGESSNLEVEVSASNILAIQVIMGDFKTIKNQLPESWMTSSNGNLYLCVKYTGHKLSVHDKKLLVDEVSADEWLEKLLAL